MSLIRMYVQFVSCSIGQWGWWGSAWPQSNSFFRASKASSKATRLFLMEWKRQQQSIQSSPSASDLWMTAHGTATNQTKGAKCCEKLIDVQKLQDTWGLDSDSEWDGTDDQKGTPLQNCTDHATIELTRLAPCDLQIRISLLHHRSAWAKTRYPYRRILSDQPIKKIKLQHDTDAMSHAESFFATNAMSALAFCSKCIDSNHRSTPMTHVHKSSLSDRHIFMSHMLRNASPAQVAQP